MIHTYLMSSAVGLSVLILLTGSVHSRRLEQDKPILERPLPAADRSQHFQNMLAGAIRHELVTLPYYDVFDWLEAELGSDGRITLHGEVVRPTTSDDAVHRVRKIEGVSGVSFFSSRTPI